MTAKIVVTPVDEQTLVHGQVVADKLGIPYRSLVGLRREGKVPGVVVNRRVIRFNLKQVAEALGVEIAEVAK